MRIHFVSDDAVSITLAVKLAIAGYVITDRFPDYTIVLVPTAKGIVIDGVDSEFERQIINRIAELTTSDITLRRVGGTIQDDKAIRILYSFDNEQAVEQGLYRAIISVMSPTSLPWLRRLYNLFLELFV